jgi:thiamine-phosphate pyrophosphorylase
MLRPRGVLFLVNDRADVASLAGASGVHVGQEDLDVAAARCLVGPDMLVGVSTHNLEQIERAAASSADYIAVGPVFGTSTKTNPDPAVGLDLVRRARAASDKPLVAIGGITLDLAASVIEAGADSVAVISGILAANDPYQRTREYLKTVEAAKHATTV